MVHSAKSNHTQIIKLLRLYQNLWHNMQNKLKIVKLFIWPMTDFTIDDIIGYPMNRHTFSF